MRVATATLVGSPGLSCDCCKTGDVNRDLDLVIIGKGLYKGIPNHHFHGKTVGSLPTLFTKHVLGAIESYHSDCSASVSSSGQTTQVGLNNSWSGIQSYATGLSTERSSVYSWRDDEFDRVNTQKVHQLLWDVAEMLFEGKVSSRTQGLQMECKEWTKHSPHLRILGSQLVLPRDEGFQHVQKRTSSSKTIPSPSFLDSTNDMKELCLWGQKLVATHSPVHSALGSRETSCSDPSLYSFLEEEIYEVDGKIEEYFAFDTKEIDDEGLEFRKIPKKCNRGVPPVSPNACIKDAVTAEVFDDVWRDVVEIIGELIRKHWENELTDEDTQMVNLETPGGKLLPVPASHVTVDTFSIPPSRGSESRSTSFWSNVTPSQTSRMSSSFHSSLKGVMTIQAKPLQQRHAGLTEKTLCNQDEKHLSMGPSVLTSARNRLGRLQDHSILSSSKRMQTASCKPVAQRKLTVLSSDALRSKTRNAYRDEVLTGTKLKTGTGCLSSPSVHTTRKKHLPPIHLETLENNLSVPRNLLRRGRNPHSRESRAVPESTGQQPLGERPIALDHSSRPNTTHTFRSDTPFKRSFTPLDFACRTRTGRGSCTADHAGIGVTGVSVGISCSGSTNFSEPLHHQQRQLLNHTFIEGEEEKCQPPWGPHQPRALNRNLTYGKKKFQMVSS
ncbi:protein FAM149A-like [Acipenser ruthenus]|uniref:protein FAM149A-like n=1 Tax=Acipenser ruthenus TaxID=7906 RepID=UPI002742510A|nr:protein FAM149A-like [Acipenser ruthenus]